MSTREDLLQKAPMPADRVFYATGILLDAQDFGAEQTYHRSRLARALAYLHGTGTAAGLRVEWEEPLQPGDDPAFPAGREEMLRVHPGIAIDRLGRIVEVPRAACIRLDRWYDGQAPDDLEQALHGEPFNGVVADVFIRFVTCEHGKTPAFAAGPFDALDAVQPSRLRDFYQLELVVRKETDPPLPGNPWPDLSAITGEENARTVLHEAILDAWREGTDWWDQDGPVPLAEHGPKQDPTSVFLARLVIPTTEAEAEGVAPLRTAEPVLVDNDSRQFVYPPGALARWLERLESGA